jgi:hypothetical protein
MRLCNSQDSSFDFFQRAQKDAAQSRELMILLETVSLRWILMEKCRKRRLDLLASSRSRAWSPGEIAIAQSKPSKGNQWGQITLQPPGTRN